MRNDSHHQRSGNAVRSVFLAVGAVSLTAGMWVLGWLPPMERATGDLLLRTSSSAHDGRGTPVIAILIDDRSVDEYGPLPWPRDRMAALVESLAEAGALGIAIDMIFAEPTTLEADEALGNALEKIPSTIATAFDRDGEWLLPMARFGGAADASHAYGEVGPDGVVRTIAATKQGQGLSLPALSLAAARMFDPTIPVEAGIEIQPEFRPAPQNIPTISVADVFSGSIDPKEIAGRIAVLGVAATGAGDQFVVPTGPRHTPVPGVLAHASATTSIVRGRLLKSPNSVWSIVAVFILCLGVQLIRDRRGAFDIAVFAGLAVGLVLVAVAALRFGLFLVPLTTLLTSAVLSALIREAVESHSARRESGRLLQAVLEHVGAERPIVPRTADGRLDALRHLQEKVLEEDATRKALLDGMSEGVVLWGPGGEVALVNPAAHHLWGGVPDISEITRNPDSSESHVITRGSRSLSIGITDLGRGYLAILRDISAERALEQRRIEMQRLVSHELKTPLASIAGFGENLERYELSPDEQRHVASLIRGEAERLRNMVTAFLDLERLGGGHWEGETNELDLGLVVAERLEVLGAAADAQGLEIRPEIGDGCRIRAVPALVDRVIDNLVGNAIKYAGGDGGIEVMVRSENGLILFAVKDHGPGISGEHRAKLFDRFYRVPGSSESGSGLGLALVKEIVDWHGGCITIESDVGVGSEFRVSLPAIEED